MKVEELFQPGQAAAQIFPVSSTRLNEGGQLLDLLPADGRLDIKRL